MILAQWDILKACASSANHSVFKYKVKYNEIKTTEALETLNIITGEVNGTRVEAFLKGLVPHKNYSIQIAVVDEQGIVGPFTDPVALRTPEDG